MTFISYAQNFEDVILWRALRHVEHGFYIDVGAAHPDVESVTKAFYARGWRGINIEPMPELHARLLAARAHDINLAVALGERSGDSDFFVVEGTGLSTLRAELIDGYTALGFVARRVSVPVMTLADICRRYAPTDIHVLKVDVEGSERAVLAGADFAAFRPWVVVVEATLPGTSIASHEEWEPILAAADYRFALFDGLNRFYLAGERDAELRRHFQAPANVFDDFLRAADTEWSRRIAEAEATAAVARQESAAMAARLAAAEAWRAELRRTADQAIAREQATAEQLIATKEKLRVAKEHQRITVATADARAARLRGERDHAVAWLRSMRGSTSWRLSAPLRGLGRLRRGGADQAVMPWDATYNDTDVSLEHFLDPTPPAPPPSAPAAYAGSRARRVVHQFHSGSAVGDAITIAMLLTRDLLRDMGFTSDIFVQHRDPGLVGELRLMEELPTHPDYVLIVRHSMGYDALARIAALPATKVLLYHNITPPHLLPRMPVLQHYAKVGRNQLAQLRPHIVAALADSDYNAVELRALGYAPVATCTLLFDIERLRARAVARPPSRHAGLFTILFVGRVMEAKAQDALIAAYGEFRRMFRQPSRLVLVGRVDPEGDPFRAAIDAAIDSAWADDLAEHVVFTGLVSDAERDDWYGAADLYVSLSHHEGFAVPLVEAMAFGVPVLAWPCGAVPYTLGGAATLLTERDPAHVGVEMAALASDPVRRNLQVRRQYAALDRFALEHQLPALREALALAGAIPAPADAAREAMAANLRFTVVGHVNKTYSLAAINRSLALALEGERPGAVRVIPVETHPTTDLSEVPADVRGAIGHLAARPPHATGPEIVISQHYPVYVPPRAGDVTVALFFWEESLVPAETIAVLNAGFSGVLAPSAFVARALLDSGLTVPVRRITHLPHLATAAPASLEAHARGGRFTFLHVSSCFPRKGVDVLLAAYAGAFRCGDPVRLVIKGFPNPHNNVAEQLAALRCADPELPDIELIDADLAEADLLKLYASADAVVLPTRGEGLNLPAAEALAAGLPLIVTGYGGHMDFCHAANARLVDYRIAASGSHLATGHSLWAEPDQADLACALREAVTNRPARSRTEQGLATVRALAQPSTTLRTVGDAALDLLLTPPPPPARIAFVSTWRVRCGVAEYARHMIEGLLRHKSPHADVIGSLTILADDRTPSSNPGLGDPGFGDPVPDPELDGVIVRPLWRLGLRDGIELLETALGAEDPDIVVIQHQPGLIEWPRLAELLGTAALRGRIVAVALHSTLRLADAEPAERAAALAALAGVSRVMVHTIADLNRLHGLGLRDNVTLMPHGVALPAQPAATIEGEADEPITAGPVIGCYGFFLPDKGLPQLIEAVHLLRDRWQGIRLRLVNAEYPAPVSAREIAYCRAIAAEWDVEVEWMTGFLEDGASLARLAGCDAVVLPYQHSKEASSAAMRTALVAGVPVLVTPLALFDEAGAAVVRLGGTDPASIAAGIDALLRDEARRREVSHAAKRWLADRDWTSIATRMFGMLLGLRRTALCDAHAPVAGIVQRGATEVVRQSYAAVAQ